MKARTNNLLIGIAILATLVSPLSLTAQSKGIPLGVNSKTDDSLGQAFAYDLKNEVGRSSLFQYTSDKYGFHLCIVSVPVDTQTTKNIGSAISVTLVINSTDADYFVDQWVLIVNANSADMAKKLMISVNDDMELLKTAVANQPTAGQVREN
jgi:hypothetical protein